MARQAIGIGAAANDGTGDPLRTAFQKTNENVSEIYSLLGGDTLTVGGARTALGLGTTDSPTFAGVTLGALSSIHFTGLTANALLYSTDGTTLAQSANLTFSETGSVGSGPLLTVGSGAAGTIGLSVGTALSGYVGLWTTAAAQTANNYFLRITSSAISINTPGQNDLNIYFGASNTARMRMQNALNPTLSFGSSEDAGLTYISAGVLAIGNGSPASFAGSLKLTNTQNVGYQELDEMTAPAGAANSVRLFCQDNGAGKSQLMCIFGSGAAQQLAIEV